MDTEISDKEALKVVNEVADEKKNGSPSESRLLSRSDILGQTYVAKIERVEVPEWSGHVLVRELSGRQRDQFELSQLQGKGNNRKINLVNMRAKLVAYSIVDEKGKLVFSEDDARQLGDLSARALTRVYRVAAELSGLSAEDEEELTDELGEEASA